MSLRRAISVIAIPSLAIILALAVGGVVMILSSPLVNGSLDVTLPFVAYAALASGAFGSVDAIVQTVVSATPLILAGLAVGIGFKAGLFNIGAQGQFLVGAVAAAAVGAGLAHASPFVAIPAALIAAMLAGAAYGFIPGFLKAFTGAHEVVTTIMLNYVAIQLVAYLITGPLRAGGATFARSPDVASRQPPQPDRRQWPPRDRLRLRGGPAGLVAALSDKRSDSKCVRSAPIRTRRATRACLRRSC